MNIKKQFLLFTILLGAFGLVYADSDGIWHEAEDFRGGELGSDEGYPDFTLNSRLELGPNGYIEDLGGDVTTFKINSQGAQQSSIDFYAGGVNEWSIGKNSGNDFYIGETGVNTRIFVQQGGRVGVGTTSPLELLHVVGTVRGTNFKIGNQTLSEIYVDENQANSITSNMIVDGTISLNDMQPGILDSTYVNEGQVNSITSAMIVDGTILAGDINLNTIDPFYVNENQANSISSAMLIDGTIQIDDINTVQFDSRYVNEGQANSITSNMIVDNTIVAGDINLVTIDPTYVNEGQVNSITSSMIVNGAITVSDLDLTSIDARYVNEGQTSSVTSTMIVDGTITTADVNIGQFDGRYVNENQANSITSNMIVDGTISNNDVDSSSIQERVSGTCGTDASIKAISQSGGVTCEVDDKGVETVSAGAGISVSGGSTATATVSADTGYLQRRVTGACGPDNAIQTISASGTVTCDPDDGIRSLSGTGGITTSVSGTTATIGVNNGQIQATVNGNCPSGQYIRQIYQNGGVLCEEAPVFWESAGGSTIRPESASNIQVGGQVRANSFVYNSDERLKDDIVDLSDSLEMVKSLNPVAYTMKETGSSEVGLIAQEVQLVAPEVVHGEGSEYLGVDYAKLVPYLIGAIQEQQAQIEELTERVESLEE